MKNLLRILIRRESDNWWTVTSAEGDPPTERVRMFTWPQVLDMIRHMLNRQENK